jgi:two-component system chemotaxis response regulator CheB
LEVIGNLKDNLRQPVLITQHMPATFTALLAEHISRTTAMPCREGSHGEIVQGGSIYVAPGGRHMEIVHKDGQASIRLTDDPPESFCRPAADPMFRSLAKVYGRRLCAVVLTGMGSDGLRGAEAIVAAGGTVVAQDQETSVVWGMPGAVATAGLCSAVMPLPEIAPYIRNLAMRPAA